jgi:hypothetical protein
MLGEHAFAVLPVQQPGEEAPVGEPLVDGVAEHVLDLGAHVDRGAGPSSRASMYTVSGSCSTSIR